jgi:hypothetical protein
MLTCEHDKTQNGGIHRFVEAEPTSNRRKMMTGPFLAMITPLSSGDPPLGFWGGRPPNYVDIGGPGPQPPGSPGQPPLGFWGGRPPNYVDIGGPGPQPPGSPGQPPLGFWGGRPPNYVDIGGPGPQPPWGAHPSHPIWRPDLGFWGGRPPNYVDIGGPGPQPRPEHPIVLPPDLPPTLPPPDERPIDWKVIWSPQTGWAVIGVPTGPVVTPSASPA